jgi:hypothetical protein
VIAAADPVEARALCRDGLPQAVLGRELLVRAQVVEPRRGHHD